jgi:dihydroflavonol-4-reductase
MSTEKRILITGASGSLGQQLLYEFSLRDCKPIAHVRESSDTRYIDSLGLEKRIADLRSDKDLEKLVQGVDGIIHTAALVNFRRDRLTQYTGINTFGAINLYKAARKAGVSRFVHVSTVAATAAIERHGDGNGRPGGAPVKVTEETKYNLGHFRIPYFMTKRAAEEELLKLAKDGSPELIIVNPSIIVAPSRTGDDRGKARKIFSKPVLPGYHNRVNIVDIRDVAPGIIAALERGRSGERYILAGDNLTARELVLAASAALHKAPHVAYIPKACLRFAARVSLFLNRVTGRSRIRFYPDIVKLLDYDWAYSSMKARKELGYTNRSAWVTIDDLLNNSFNGTWLKPAPEHGPHARVGGE